VGNLREPVENLPDRHWLGCVVPKRHARRAVTRTLIKRQMRSVFERHTPGLPKGLWLLRLSQGFAVSEFVSARSAPLTLAVRHELEGLLMGVTKRGQAISNPPVTVAKPTASPSGNGPAFTALPGDTPC
jgi:ribonuclease P protein component